MSRNTANDNKRTTTPTFMHNLPLKVSAQQARELDIRFELLRQLYNSVLGYILRRDRAMKAIALYQDTISAYREVKKQQCGHPEASETFKTLEKERRRLGKILATLATEHGLTKTRAEQEARRHARACHIKNHLDAVTVQVIADRAFAAYSDYRFKQKGRPRFKTWKNALRSISGKQNVSLRFVGDKLIWHTPLRNKSDLVLKPYFNRKDKQGTEQYALNPNTRMMMSDLRISSLGIYQISGAESVALKS